MRVLFDLPPFFIFEKDGRVPMKKYTARYELDDIKCDYCGDRQKTKYGTCGHRLCPHIMGNLSDLCYDEKFREAVERAEKSGSNHRYTLRHLKKHGIKRKCNNTYSGDGASKSNIKAECAECGYWNHGFVCDGKDGSCLRDWVRSIQQKGGGSRGGS